MKKCSNYHTVALVSHSSKVILKILQARLQQYVEENSQMCKLDLEKTEEQKSNCQHCYIVKKTREFQKNIYFCFIDYAKALDCVDHSKLWKILEVMGGPDHLTCLLRSLYVGQEATAIQNW